MTVLRDEIDYRLKEEVGEDVNFYEITDDILKIFRIHIDEMLHFRLDDPSEWNGNEEWKKGWRDGYDTALGMIKGEMLERQP